MLMLAIASGRDLVKRKNVILCLLEVILDRGQFVNQVYYRNK